jgi:hypothetical protein
MAQTTGQRYAVERVKPPETLIKVGNPIFSWLLRSPLRGLIGGHLMLLHFRGRKTRRCYKVVAGRRTIDGQLGVLTNSAWRTNVRCSARVEVTPSRASVGLATPKSWRTLWRWRTSIGA